MLVDSHCHLDFPDFAAELDGVLDAARAQGVGHFLTIGTGMSRFAGVRAVAERASDIHCTVGVHPHEAAVEPLSGPEVLLKESEHEKVVGFGEGGLDYYYEHSPRDAQIANFRHHIAAARSAQLPLVVHTRDAEDDTIAILQRGDGPRSVHRRHPLLHRHDEAGACGAQARVLCVGVGHRDVQEGR